MTRARWTALLIATIVLAASIVAATLLPDPWWIKGLYDAADGDEALSLVWEKAPATEAAGLTPVLISLLLVLPWLQLLWQHQSFSLASSSRAPPRS